MIKIHKILFLASLACLPVAANKIDDLKNKIEKIEIQFEIIYHYLSIATLDKATREEAQISSIKRLNDYLLDMEKTVLDINNQAIKPANKGIVEGVAQFTIFATNVANFLKDLKHSQGVQLKKDMQRLKKIFSQEILVSPDRRKIRALLVELLDATYLHVINAEKASYVIN